MARNNREKQFMTVSMGLFDTQKENSDNATTQKVN